MARARTERPAHHARVALTAGSAQLTELAAALGRAGLTERAVRLCFSIASVVHAARRVDDAPAPTPIPRAAVAPWLFAAGRPVPERAARRALGDALDRAVELSLVELADDQAQATLRLLPVGESITVCPPTAPGHGGNPDDSSAHLVGALSHERVGRWLDLGTGNAHAPLAARGRGRTVLATDVDDDALSCAALGCALSGASEIEVRHSDLFEAIPSAPWDRITFNAPIPPPGDDIFDRFAAQAPGFVSADGEILIHARVARTDPWRELPGELIIARYTPAEVEPGFAVLRWRPREHQRVIERACTLSPETPHIVRAWLPDVG